MLKKQLLCELKELEEYFREKIQESSLLYDHVVQTS
jgi:hypothetical protein